MSRLVWLIPLFPLLGAARQRALRAAGHRAPRALDRRPRARPRRSSSRASCSRASGTARRGRGELFPWISAGPFKTAVAAQVDQLTAVMLLVVTGVGFLIHLYSIGYMHGDDGYARFFTYLNLFVFSMVMLVLAGNFLLLYVFWEAVGLCSYLLDRLLVREAVGHRRGQEGLHRQPGGRLRLRPRRHAHLDHLRHAQLRRGLREGRRERGRGHATWPSRSSSSWARAGKSAQLPLYTWLPDAMEGPTPVSALIHAATMVTAGVYMVARCHKLFEMAPLSLEVVAWVGAITAVFAATHRPRADRHQAVLAYSTISQLGYMFAAVGVGAYAAGIFHLVTHAFFKALLFLGAGSVIHGLGGEQDLRKMGGLAPRMMTTTVTFLVGGLGLAGRAAARRLLLQGRDPGRRVPRGPPGALVAPARRARS